MRTLEIGVVGPNPTRTISRCPDIPRERTRHYPLYRQIAFLGQAVQQPLRGSGTTGACLLAFLFNEFIPCLARRGSPFATGPLRLPSSTIHGRRAPPSVAINTNTKFLDMSSATTQKFPKDFLWGFATGTCLFTIDLRSLCFGDERTCDEEQHMSRQ